MGKLVWITGLSGSGKTTIGKSLFSLLKEKHSNTVFLDGDVIREMFDNDLGYCDKDRLKNAWRIAKICQHLTSQSINVICSTVSLYKEIHDYNSTNNSKYYEIFLHCDIEELVRRDQKGLYTKAVKGELDQVVGIGQNFDKPAFNTLEIDNTEKKDLDLKVDKILKFIGE